MAHSPATPMSSPTGVVICCHGKERADLRSTEFEVTAGLAAARHSGKGQCCLSYLSSSCRNGTGCPHLHPQWFEVQRLKWVPTPSGPSAAQLSTTPGTGSLRFFVRRTNRSYDVPADEFYQTEHLAVAVRMGSGTACSHHLRETCLNGEACRFLHPSDRMLIESMREEIPDKHPVLLRAMMRQQQQATPPIAVARGSAVNTIHDESFRLPGALRAGASRVSPPAAAVAAPAAPAIGPLHVMPPPVIAEDDDGSDDDDDDLLGMVHREREQADTSAAKHSADGSLGLFRVEEGGAEAIKSPQLGGGSVSAFGNSTSAVQRTTPPVDFVFGWSPMVGSSQTAAASNGARPVVPSPPAVPAATWSTATPTLRPAAAPFTPQGAARVDVSIAPAEPAADPFDVFTTPVHHPMWSSPPTYEEYHSSAAAGTGGSPYPPAVATPSPHLNATSLTAHQQQQQSHRTMMQTSEIVPISVSVESKEIYLIDPRDFEPTRNLTATIRIGSGIACSHHLRDRCNNGSSCRFLHPIDAVLSSTMRSELGRNHPVLKQSAANTPAFTATRPTVFGTSSAPVSAKSTPMHGATAPIDYPPSLAMRAPGSEPTTPSLVGGKLLPKPKSHGSSSDAALEGLRGIKAFDAPALAGTDVATVKHASPPAGAWAAVASRAATRAPSPPARRDPVAVAAAQPSTPPVVGSGGGPGRGWETKVVASPTTANKAVEIATLPTAAPPPATAAQAALSGSRPSLPLPRTAQATSSLTSPMSAAASISGAVATSPFERTAVPREAAAVSSATNSTASSGGLDADLAKVLSALWELRAEGHVAPLVREVVRAIKAPVPAAHACAAAFQRGAREGLLKQYDEGSPHSWRVALTEAIVPSSQEADLEDAAPPKRENTEEPPSPLIQEPQEPPQRLAVAEATKGKDVAVLLAAHGVTSVGAVSPTWILHYSADEGRVADLRCDACSEPRWLGTVSMEPCDHVICTGCALGKLAKTKRPPQCPCCSESATTAVDVSGATTVPPELREVAVQCTRCKWCGKYGDAASHSCAPPSGGADDVCVSYITEAIGRRRFDSAVNDALLMIEGRGPWGTAKLSKLAVVALLSLRAEANNGAKDHDAARSDADNGLKIDPRHVGCMLQRAIALSEQGKHGQAISTLQKAIAVDADNEEIATLLARVKTLKLSASTDAAAESPVTNTPPDEQHFGTAKQWGKVTPPPSATAAGGARTTPKPRKPLDKVNQFVASSVDCARRKDFGGLVEGLSNTFDFFSSLDRRGRSIILARRAIGYLKLKKLGRARSDAKRAADLNATLTQPWVFVTQLSSLLRDGPALYSGFAEFADTDVVMSSVPKGELHGMYPHESVSQFEALMEYEVVQPFNAHQYGRKSVASNMIENTWSDPEETASVAGRRLGAAAPATSAGNVFASLRHFPEATRTQIAFERDLFEGENPFPMSAQLKHEIAMLQSKLPPSVENLRHIYRLLSLSCIVWTLVHYQNMGGLPPESVDLDTINVEIYWAKAIDRFRYFFKHAVRRGVLPKWLVFEAARDAHLGILNRMAHAIDAQTVGVLPQCYGEFALVVLDDTPEAQVLKLGVPQLPLSRTPLAAEAVGGIEA